MGGSEGKGAGREGREGRREKGKGGNQDKKGRKGGGRKNWMPAPVTQSHPGAKPQWPRAVWVSVQRNPALGRQGWSPKEGKKGN